MSKRKDRRIKSKRDGMFPKCYGDCGTCAAPCEFYAEWKSDQVAAAVDRENRLTAALEQAKWVQQ